MTKISICEPEEKEIEIIKGKCYIGIHHETKNEKVFLVLDTDCLDDLPSLVNLETGYVYSQDDFDDHYYIDREVKEIKVIG